MAIRLASYLKQNRFGVFYFRRVIPPDLQPYLAFRQIARSTRTSRVADARGLVLRFIASVELLFARIRDMKKRPEGNDVCLAHAGDSSSTSLSAFEQRRLACFWTSAGSHVVISTRHSQNPVYQIFGRFAVAKVRV